MSINAENRLANDYDDSKCPILRSGQKNHWKFSAEWHKVSDCLQPATAEAATFHLRASAQ
jgi:hypothetical protein